MAKILESRELDELTLIADFETVTGNTKYYKEHNDTKVIYWEIISLNDLNPTFHSRGTTMEGFFDYLSQLPKYYNKNKKLQSYQVYFHNLSFDGNFIYKYLNRIDPNQETFKYLINGNKIYSITWENIIFKDSILILSNSVNNLAKSLEGQPFIIDKHNYTQHLSPEDIASFYDQEPKESCEEFSQPYQDYVTNDVRVVARALYNVYNVILKNFGVNILKFYTAGSIMRSINVTNAIKYFGSRNKKIKIDPKSNLPYDLTLSREYYDYFKDIFSGGFTRGNNNYKGKMIYGTLGKTINYIDINSSYPASMSGNLPYGNPQVVNMKKWSDIEKLDLTGSTNYFIKIQWLHTPCPNYIGVDFLPNVKKDFIGFYWLEELKFLFSQYNNISFKVIRLFKINVAPYLQNSFIGKNGFYTLKQNATDPVTKLTYKIFLNAGYGKFAEKPHDEVLIWNNGDKENKIKDKTSDWDDIEIIKKHNERRAKLGFQPRDKFQSYTYRHKWSLDNNFNVWDYWDLKTDTKRESHIILASFITMKSRMNLFNVMTNYIGLNNFVYADTDSIFYIDENDTIKNKLEQSNLIHPTELGKWSYEERELQEFMFMRRKMYVYKNKKDIEKIKAAGLNSNIIKNLSMDEFVTGVSRGSIDDGDFKKIFTPSGIIFEVANKKILDLEVVNNAYIHNITIPDIIKI